MVSDREPAYCQRHPDQRVTTACSECGNSICRLCIEEFGYFCSAECLEESRASISSEEIEEREHEEDELREMARKTVYGLWIGVAVVFLLAAWWIWSTFISAPGKPAWTWMPEKGTRDMEIVWADASTLSVLVGRRLHWIKSRNGKEVASLELPFDPGGSLLQVNGTDEYLSAASSTLAFTVDLSDRTCRSMKFSGPCRDVAFGAAGERVFCLQPQSYDYLENSAVTPASVVCRRFGEEDPLWRVEADKDFHFQKILTVGDRLAVLEQTGTFYEAGGTCRLAVHDLDSGRRLWRLTFEAGVVWGPTAMSDCLAVQAGGRFVVVDMNGEQKWSAEVPAAGHVAHVVTEKHVFLQQEAGEECRDLQTGQRIWRCDVILDGEFLAEDGKRLIASGFTSKAAGAGGLLSPGGDDMNSIIEDISGGTGGLVEGLLSRPVLVALNAASGNVIWRREGVSGSFYGDCSSIVGVSGVGSINVLQMFSGGGEGTTIRQFSPRKGDTMYTRNLDYSLGAYEVSGGRLVGVAYGMPKGAGDAVLTGLRLK